MAKNKKPRKPYHRKPCRIPMLSVSDREEIMDLLNDVEFAIYNLFPLGNAKEQHVEACRRIMNHAVTGMFHRWELLDEDECNNALSIIYKANDALVETIKRRNKLFNTGRRDHLFVFTAEELRAVEQGYVTASRFVEDSLEVCSATCLKEYFVATIIDKRINNERIASADAKTVVDSIFKELAETPTDQWLRLT